MSCDSFHLFPMLPTELRVKIWALTFPGPRVLELIWFNKEWFCATESRLKPHPALFANRESHEVFREKWSRVTLRQVVLSADSELKPLEAVSYFNPQIDTLYIGGSKNDGSIEPNVSIEPEAISALTRMDFGPSIRFLAIEIREWAEGEKMQKDWELGLFANFPKLESFIIVDYDLDWWYIIRGSSREVGEVEFVSPTQLDMQSNEEMAPPMLKRLADLVRSHPEANIPPVTVKEVLRGGVRMQYS